MDVRWTGVLPWCGWVIHLRLQRLRLGDRPPRVNIPAPKGVAGGRCIAHHRQPGRPCGSRLFHPPPLPRDDAPSEPADGPA